MKIRTIVFIATSIVLAFGALVFYGLKNARGIPVTDVPAIPNVLRVPFIDAALQPVDGVSAAVWKKIPETKIALTYQVTVLPWPTKGLAPTVTVKAFHNGNSIHFLLSWEDSTADTVKAPGVFPDAAALLFPIGDSVQPASLMMGFLGKANIWHWKADIDRVFWGGQPFSMTTYADFYYPFEEQELFPVSRKKALSAVSDNIAVRVGTVTPKEQQRVSGRGRFADDGWQVHFLRALQPEGADEMDATLRTGVDRLCALAVWNGRKGDRGGRKYISEWVTLRLER